MQLVQKMVVEDASKASPIMPQRVALVNPDGTPWAPAAASLPTATAETPGTVKMAANPGANPTMAKIVSALVDAGIMAPAGDE